MKVLNWIFFIMYENKISLLLFNLFKFYMFISIEINYIYGILFFNFSYIIRMFIVISVGLFLFVFVVF